ncbi:VOC family protein [Fulvimarina endophytica]|uniref:VOC family protein n=1 Tax=Fulvimarina endophytica TaxID=2293836 RepID=A0A371WZB6_9HYPH|nr:VOC family protein [Fulvimarina endophytica]RFC62114.1 VOC family protein [Fulvimarina endophytica]
MTPQRITLVTLGVADIAASRAFYARLGWQPVPGENADVSFYRMNGMALALFDRSELAADQGRPGASLGTGAVTLAQNFPGTAEVDAAFEAAIAAGATILKRPEAVFWGGYSGYWADPDGHVWELAHNPFWSLDAEGALTIPDPA